MANTKKNSLKKKEDSLSQELGPWTLWGLGVGYVISGMYFGWNLGLPMGGTLGMGLATLMAIVLYLCFSFCYAELACSMPKAGGAFHYTKVALGPFCGHLAGMAQFVEFVFAPPAIAMAIGHYCSLFIPQVSPLVLSITFYFIFTLINILGVKQAAIIELVVTLLAVLGLILFATMTLPSFSWEKFTVSLLPHGPIGAFSAIPFAIWFFLAIEGLANVAEETENPQKNISLGFMMAISTLVVLCLLTFVSSIGVGGWKPVVFAPGSLVPSDSPLPLAMAQIFSKDSLIYNIVTFLGLFGLIASFHGILLAAGRVTFEMGRQKIFPQFIGKAHHKWHTPANALILNMMIGLIALLTGKTSQIITLAVFGALILYFFSLISLFVLRKNNPKMERPFKVPFYPAPAIIAFILVMISFLSLSLQETKLTIIFILMGIVAVVWYFAQTKRRAKIQTSWEKNYESVQ